MRKLAIAAAAFSAAVFAANYILPQSWLLYMAVICAVIAVAIACTGRKWVRGAILALVFFALGLVRFQLQYQMISARTEQYSGESCELQALLLDYPEKYDSYNRLTVRLIGDELPKLKAIVYDYDFVCGELEPGAIISFTGKVKPANTLYGESYLGYYSRGIYLKISGMDNFVLLGQESMAKYLPVYISHALIERIDTIFPDSTAAFMRALMLGDKTEIYNNEALTLEMQRSGLMHVVAVSGMHVVFFIGLIYYVLGRGRYSALLCLAAIWVFVLVSGASPSAVRAGFMQTLLLIAPIIRRQNDPPTALTAILGIILMKNPYAAASISLQLSFGAMAGILIFSGRIYRRLFAGLKNNWLSRYLCGTLASSIGVIICTTPVMAMQFGYVQLGSFISNLLALWAVSLCFCFGWIGCAIAHVPVLSNIVIAIANLLAKYILLVIKLVAALPYAAIYTETPMLALWIIGAYMLFIICGLMGTKIHTRLILPTAAALVGLGLIICYVNHDYSVGRDTFAVLDVGQGSCTVAMAGDSTVLIDCGNINSVDDAGELAGRYLISRGRNSVDALILTHLHEDHADGIAMLLEMVEVKEIIIPEAAVGELLTTIQQCAMEKNVPIRYIYDNESLCFGDIAVQLYIPAQSLSTNENSMAVRLTMGGHSALITGDSSDEVERQLAADYALDDTELLVVGHHGSVYSTSEQLLRELNGSTAIISVGYNNYGHPADETLERLAFCGYNVYRTDQDGTVEIRWD